MSGGGGGEGRLRLIIGSISCLQMSGPVTERAQRGGEGQEFTRVKFTGGAGVYGIALVRLCACTWKYRQRSYLWQS